jgi:peptide/nickel transport system substrate-binding protein
MTPIKLTRRQILASSLAAGVAGTFGVAPRFANAQDGTLTIRFDGDIASVDPGYMVGGVDIEVQRACMPALVEYSYDSDGQLGWKPTAYVKSITQRDELNIDFELNTGFMWTNHYGELTAEDVKYSFERMKNSDWSGNFEAMDRVDVTGTHTGTIVMNSPFSPFMLITLASGPATILCAKAVEDAGGKLTTDFIATCGPYTFEWTPQQRITFTPNPDWTGPAPGFSEVRALIITEAKAAELALEAGEVSCTEITTDTVVRYADNPPAGVKTRVAGSLQYMWMGMNTEHPKLQDIRVRKAIQHAVDVDSIIQGAYSGTSERSHGIVCPGLIGHRTESKYSYDPEAAKALLAEAGVSGLEVDLKTLNAQERILAAQIIQANLAAVGITANVIPVESGPFWEMGYAESGDQWKDLQLWIMRYGTNPDPYECTQWFVSSQVGVWNWERWTDPEFDELYTKGIAETDPVKREAIYLRMQEIMEDTGAYVWINHESETFAHTDDISIDVFPSGEMDVRDFKPA